MNQVYYKLAAVASIGIAVYCMLTAVAELMEYHQKRATKMLSVAATFGVLYFVFLYLM